MAMILRGLASRRVVRAMRWVLVLALLAALGAAVSWSFKRSDNEQIRAATALQRPDATATEGVPAPVVFAQAHELAVSDRFEAALARYRLVFTDKALGTAARYNSANLLMRQAMALKQSDNPGQAIALVELAKQTYRAVLRAEPGHWDARYNYERALRLQPDPEDIDAPIPGPRNDAERAASRSRGVAAGMP